MGDSSEGWSSSEDEDEHNPDEYNPDEDEFNPDEYNPDEDEFNPHSSVQTLKVFYWTAGVGAALLAIFTSANVISSTVLCGLSPCSSLGLLPHQRPLLSACINFGRVA